MPQNNKHIINERRSRIADLYLKGMAQYRIAGIVGVTQQQVSADLRVLSKKWKESALIDIDTIKAKDLAKIDELEREYYEAWERSRKVQTKKRMKKSERSGGELKEQSMEEREMIGDPRFLEGVRWCIAKREGVFGYGAPKKLDHRSMGEKLRALDSIIILPANERNNTDPEDQGD